MKTAFYLVPADVIGDQRWWVGHVATRCHSQEPSQKRQGEGRRRRRPLPSDLRGRREEEMSGFQRENEAAKSLFRRLEVFFLCHTVAVVFPSVNRHLPGPVVSHPCVYTPCAVMERVDVSMPPSRSSPPDPRSFCSLMSEGGVFFCLHSSECTKTSVWCRCSL